MAGRNDDQIRCSFCNKPQSQVRKLIAGPGGVYICDECIDVCAEIMEEEFEYENTRNINPFDDINLLKPEDVRIVKSGGHRIVVIFVPPAPQALRPVYVGGDLYAGSYYRCGEGDRRIPREEIDALQRRAAEHGQPPL